MHNKISEGLSSTLTHFETPLETALESLRRTVETSLSARSQVATDHESDRNCDGNVTVRADLPYAHLNDKNKDEERGLNPLGDGYHSHTEISGLTGSNVSHKPQMPGYQTICF